MRPQEIPLLRRKVERVLERASLSPVSHSGKVLRHVLDTFPRDDLFQIGEEELYDIAIGILHLQERQRLRLFVRADVFGRFVFCIVYVPLDRYNTALRLRLQAILLQAFNGLSAEFSTQFSEAVLARVLFTIRTTPGQIPEYSVTELERTAAGSAAVLGRRVATGAAGTMRRGAGQCAVSALSAGFSGGLPG